MPGHNHKDACKDDYGGAAAGSESETIAIKTYMYSLKRCALFFDVHSFGQQVMTPFGYRNVKSDDNDAQLALANIMATGAAVNGRNYETGTVQDVAYAIYGSAVDWAYEGAQIKYSYNSRCYLACSCMRYKGLIRFLAHRTLTINHDRLTTKDSQAARRS